MKIDEYLKALVWGTKFKGRGSECSEQDQHRIQSYNKGKGLAAYGAQKQVKEPANINNTLRNHYSEHIGSWCKIHIYQIQSNSSSSTSANIENTPPKFVAAQINYFSYLNLPNDTLLSKLPFASVTARKPNRIVRKHFSRSSNVYENLFEVDGKDDDSINYDLPFAMLYNIYATPLAFTAYESKPNNKGVHQPICLNNHHGKKLGHITMYALEREKEAIHTQTDCRNKMHPYHNKERTCKHYVM